MVLQVNIVHPEHKADPFPFYARLRAEHPVHRVQVPFLGGAMLVSRYDDVAAALKDRRLVKDRRAALSGKAAEPPWLPSFARPLARNMLDVDGADHTRLRALVSKAFTPRTVENMRDRIQALATTLVGRLRSAGRFDLVRDYAREIPTTIIAEMLGVPVGDRHKFGRWSRIGVSSSASPWRAALAVPALWRFLKYIRRLIKQRRETRPESGDLLAALIAAEEAGDRLSEDELVAMVFLLLIAGHETTVNLIGNGVLALLRHRDQLDRLRADPALIASAVEELLRFAGPLETATERYAGEDMEIAGTAMPRGTLILAALASANRDESRFENPDTLDLARDPNPHLAFGMGPHYCLGAPLARLEAQITVLSLVQAMPGLELSGRPRWRGGLVLRGLAALPLRAGRAPAAIVAS